MGINLQGIIIDELADDMRTAMDAGIIMNMAQEMGYFPVEINYKDIKQKNACDLWVSEYIKGHYLNWREKWLFKDSQDAVLFRLKWAQ